MKNYFRVFYRLISILSKNKKAFIIAILLAILKTIFSVATSIGLGIIIQNAFLQIISSNPDYLEAFKWLIIGCVLVFAGYLLYFICYLISQKLILELTYFTGYRVRKMFFDKIRKIPYKTIEQMARGDLISRGTTDINAMAINLSFCVGEIFCAPLIIVGVFIGLLIISPLLTAIVLFFYLILIAVSLWISLKTAPKYNQMQLEIGNLNSVVEEYINGRKAIKSFCYEDQVIDLFKQVNQKQASLSKSAESKLNFIWPWNDYMETIMYAFIYFIGIIFFINNIASGSIFFPQFEIGLITAFVLLARIATGETSNSLRLIGTLQKAYATAIRIFEILDLANLKDEGTIDQSFKGAIEFKNVSFGYDKNKNVLNNISFSIKPNETVAIVGPTGSGKTTIISLLSRFYEIECGEIKIDGINIKNIKQEAIFKNISIVLQDSFLFSESVKKNIWYGNIQADEKQIYEVALKTNVDYFIKKLENGYETIISEKMNNLSLGQIQLLSIARAFMSPAKILILDEATSFVDSKTEVDIQNALTKVTKNKTVIVIAHRLSTIIKADKIIVLKNGVIQEIGNHQQLLKNKGFYYELYKANAIMETHYDI
ncbi:MAG: ABC transporter ATP-binding protein [Malacoplasma sp.]|nr:ABC transporter ATP-binding protein [Malacoplasma sp.]